MVEMVQNILAPIVRHIRQDSNMQALNTLIPPSAYNPILGPPHMVWDMGGELVPNPVPNEVLWVFRRDDDTGVPPREVEGTGTSAITLSSVRSWSRVPIPGGVQRPELLVHYRSDVTRETVAGAPSRFDATEKIRTIHKYLTRLLTSRTGFRSGAFLLWGEDEDSPPLRVGSCDVGEELTFLPVQDGDGMLEARATFELQIHI